MSRKERSLPDQCGVKVGEKVKFSKTVSESDVYLFAGITGDFSGNHVDEEYMRRSQFGRRVAHGALLVGFMSTTSTMMIAKAVAGGIPATPMSLGYDRVRFVNPVYFGDTITVEYTISRVDQENDRSNADVEIRNQHGQTVAVATHVIKWVANPGARDRSRDDPETLRASG
jgi:3-hydroxybutyryl-CoA dehydratase